MRRQALSVGFLFFILVVSQGTGAASDIKKISAESIAAMMETPQVREFVPGEIIVKFKPAAPSLSGEERMSLRVEGVPDKKTSGGETLVRIALPESLPLDNGKAEDPTLSAVKAFAKRADVEYAQPNYIFHIVSTSPNDPEYALQWHYRDQGNGANQVPGGINLPTVWDANKGDSSVVVAVIDTGILPNHPDISGSPNLVAGFDMISNTFTANDGDGRDADPTDPGDAVVAGECRPGSRASGDSWHGSHVAGTIGVGKTNNNAGVAGINWNVRVQAVRVLGKCGGTNVDINDAIRWAAGLPVPGVPDNATPAKVINMSLGGPGSCSRSPSTQAAIDDAVAAGATVIVAAGNEALDAAFASPASCDKVITVAASDYRGHLASRYSNFGPKVDIMAPGGDVRRDDNGDGNADGVLSMVKGGYAFYNGTSMAAPHVAGVAALLLAEDNSRTPQQIGDLLTTHAIARSSTQCPRPCGAGLLNAAISGSPPPSPPPPPPRTVPVLSGVGMFLLVAVGILIALRSRRRRLARH